MMDPQPTIVFLPGSGGGTPDFAVFRAGPDDTTGFQPIAYPDWRRSAGEGFSAEALIAELVAEIVMRVPRGPIYIVGLSIGGHFGYAAGLRLQAMGREIAGLCAIDSFMIASAEPSAGWQRRALVEGLELLRGRRFGEFARYLRSKFWRALLRLAGSRLPRLLQAFSSSGQLPSISGLDPIFERELTMRLLVRETAPWIASLDREVVTLKAPTVLLRTRATAGDDDAWRRRCPNIEIFEITGQHHTLFEADNIGSLREAYLAATRGWRQSVLRAS
jgi:thioesterase domain-containing protein